MLKTFIETCIPDFNSIPSAVLEKKFYIGRKDFLVGLSYDHSFISFFVLVYERTILVLQFFLINLTLKLFNFNVIWGFFPKKIFWFWIKIWLDRRKKYIPTWHFHSIIIYLPFSQYNRIPNFEEEKNYSSTSPIQLKLDLRTCSLF